MKKPSNKIPPVNEKWWAIQHTDGSEEHGKLGVIYGRILHDFKKEAENHALYYLPTGTKYRIVRVTVTSK